MLTRDHDCFVEVLLVKRTPPNQCGAGDLHLRVRVAFSTFRGDNEEVWVAARDFQDFLSALQSLEAQRRGSATLLSVSPGELEMEVHSTDRAGHMAVSGQLGRWCYAGGEGLSWCQIPFHFDFCPSLLPELLADFRSMAEIVI